MTVRDLITTLAAHDHDSDVVFDIAVQVQDEHVVSQRFQINITGVKAEDGKVRLLW